MWVRQHDVGSQSAERMNDTGLSSSAIHADKCGVATVHSSVIHCKWTGKRLVVDSEVAKMGQKDLKIWE